MSDPPKGCSAKARGGRCYATDYIDRLTEERDAAIADRDAALQGVLYIRCLLHRDVPQYNSGETISGGECAACAVSDVQAELDDVCERFAPHLLGEPLSPSYSELRESLAAKDEALTRIAEFIESVGVLPHMGEIARAAIGEAAPGAMKPLSAEVPPEYPPLLGATQKEETNG